MSLVRYSKDANGIATLWLNDPDRRNAMGEAMAHEFAAAIRQLKRDHALRALVLTGAGSAFAAGGDLNMLREKLDQAPETNRQAMLSFYDSFLCILQLPVPLIAAINGHAMGAGLCLALACDFRVISAQAKFGFNFVRLGLHPGMGATYLLPRIAGPGVALDLLVTGRTLPAADAAGMGLFHEIVAPTEVLCSAHRIATSILQCGPHAVRDTLQTMRPLPAELTRALAHEAERQSINYASDEFRQCLTAALR